MAKLLIEYKKALRSVGVKDVEDCMVWAFGELWDRIYVGMAPALWNQRHRNIFILESNEGIIEAAKKIGKAYLESQSGQIRPAPIMLFMDKKHPSIDCPYCEKHILLDWHKFKDE